MLIYAGALGRCEAIMKTMAPDDMLIGAIYTILARAVCAAYDMPPPDEMPPLPCD